LLYIAGVLSLRGIITTANRLPDADGEIAALAAKFVNTRQIKHSLIQEVLTGRIRLV